MRITLRLRTLSALVLATLLVSGCGASGSGLNLVFPRIVVDIDKDGNPSVAGISPIALSIFGIDPNQFKIDPATVQKLTDSNVQHLELLFRKDGLYTWANAKPVVPLVWDDGSFNTTQDLALKFVALDPSAQGILTNVLLPAARSSEQNVVVRFPRKDGEAEIPLRDMGGALPEPGAAVDPTTFVRMHISFDENGTPSIANISTKDIQAATGMDLSAAALPKENVQQMINAGVQHITIRTTPEGIKLWSNDKPLPTLRWSQDTLTSTADLVGQLKLIDPAIGAIVKQFLPYLNTVDANLVLKFPTGGAAPIPLP